ncbi:apolipoprotein D-like [Agrilus planipennis]|uniref:Apolipoprotein D-like n=1 Tax=Agrilus planipennis TaxID=224129 RepID=A0A1W4XVK5_AGRPL|nr:apolipoprotein D-like [Agrilus planipennis]
MFKQLLAIFFLALISFSYSQYTLPGQCSDRKNIKPVENFQFEKYGATGRKWYTIFTYISPADCQFANFTVTSNVTLNFFWERKNLTTGNWFIGRTDGVVTWTPDNGTRNGIISLKYPDIADPLIYPILGIDYDGYTLDYRCVNINSTNRMELIWARSRNRTYTAQQAAKVKQILSDNGLSDLAPTYAVQDPARCSP